jgi:NAD(P)H-dependent FMN reductase
MDELIERIQAVREQIASADVFDDWLTDEFNSGMPAGCR